jgi:hypothetical protein
MTEPKSGDPVLQELKNITKILTLGNAGVLESEIAKVANSNSRKKIWALMDGKRTTSDLVKETGMTLQGVLNFIYAAQAVDLVEYTQRQPPRRKFDYVPPAWIVLVELPEENEGEKTEEQLKTKEKKTEGEGSGPSTV